MPDYSSLTSQITQFKTAASALMTSGTLSPNDLQLVGAALNSIGNTLGVADINNAVVDGIATINTNRDAAITSFNTSTNGQRLTTAETDITVLKGKVTNIEGFVATNSTQYTTLQSTVSALQTSIATVPSAWAVQNTSYTAVNGHRRFITTQGITITLPLGPSVGMQVQFVEATGGTVSTATPGFTIARNNERIQGLQEDLVVNVAGASVTLAYVNATRGWVLV
jgi:hypothetical protein